MNAKRLSTVRAALAWLIAQKDPRGTWYSTQATVLSLKALLAAAGGALGHGERHIEVRMGERLLQELTIPADLAEVMKRVDLAPHLVPGSNRLRIVDKTGSGTGYQVTFRYHLPGPIQDAQDPPLAVSLDYNRTELAVNDTVQATARVENRRKETAPMVMLDLPIPPGFAPLSEDFDSLVQAGTIARFQVAARQILVYLRQLAPARALELSYRLRATMPVKVATPGARAYEYYAPERQSHSRGAHLEVKAKD
jgi:hypothetical protein